MTDKQDKPKPGRPTIYSTDLAVEICRQLAQGKPLTHICKQADMPNVSTVYRWMIEKNVFKEMYARAREDMADTLAAEIVEIADKADTKDSAAVNKARLQVDARKWTASKLKPRQYGEKLRVDHTAKGLEDALRDLDKAGKS